MIDFVAQPYKCNHCGKSFMQEKTLIAHMCERKRRALQRDEKRVQAGYMAFCRYWQLSGYQKSKTYEEFCDTAYYNAFVKFGSFINNVNPVYPEKFIDYVIKSGVKLDHWCRDEIYYDMYLPEILKVEPVESAAQRSLTTMMDWAEEKSANFAHYFAYATTNRGVHDIRYGHISPWIVLNTVSGKDMLQNMSDDQLDMISPILGPDDIQFWLRKFRDCPADVALVKEICKEAGID
jgi:hypothetical protein